MNKDSDQLKLLSTGYYVYGILSAIFYLFPLIFIFAGIAMLNAQVTSEKEQEVFAQAPNFIIVGVISFLYGQITSIATILAGKYIKNTKHHLFCLIVAGINCISFPLGTALGVFTFIVLLRDSVKALFNGQTTSTFGNTPPNWQ